MKLYSKRNRAAGKNAEVGQQTIGLDKELEALAQSDEEREIMERVRSRETLTERKERELRCPHGQPKSLCLDCSLDDIEGAKWDRRRTGEKRIRRSSVGFRSYSQVKIASGDCDTRCNREKSPSMKVPADTVALRELAPEDNEMRKIGFEIGYLRTPIDAPRCTRTDAPDWFHLRSVFFQTLDRGRAERAERIFVSFYMVEQTDTEIA